MKHLRRAQRRWAAGFLAVLVGFGVSGGCAAPRSAPPAADAAALAHERLLQQELAFTINRERRQRLADLSWPLRSAGAELCGDNVAPEFGFRLESLEEYDDDQRYAAGRALDLQRPPTVTIVVSGGPADGADVQVGDVLTHVGRYRLPRGERGVELGIRRLREFASGPPPFPAVPVRLERQGDAYIQELIPELLCDYPVVLVEDDAINAFADGSAAYLTNGMMRFTESDEELQVVIAHELAHNIGGHIAARKKNAVVGALLGLAAEVLITKTTGLDSGGTLTMVALAAGAAAYSQDFEREADYVGMYLLARAGVDTSRAAMFWRRMAVEHTGSIENNHRSTHPSTPERFVRLDGTHDEIEAKRAAGLPLVPNRKDEP